MADLADLLKGRRPEDFTARQLMTKAHWRWDRAQLHEAFLLFDAAARRAAAEGDRGTEVCSRNRAAITLFRSGRDREEARARLRAVLEHYRADPGDEADRHWVEWASTALLIDMANTSPERFAAAFWEAIAECNALGRAQFPRILPQQDELLETAYRAGAKDVVKHLIQRMRARRPMPRSLKKRLAMLEEWAG